MTLSKHVNATKLENEILKRSKKVRITDRDQYLSEYDSNASIPKFEIPQKSSPADLIYKYIGEELDLDGIPNLNLASFVNTSLEDTPKKLIVENIVKNLADNDEYPSLIDLQQRCISILSNLWHAPSKVVDGNNITNSVGTATTGSSEAIMLAGLALKKRWQEKRKKQGKSTENPNILMATCAQVALEKFARYFDVENRLIHINEEAGHLMDTSKIKENVDENTIGIFVIMGSTFTGAFEPVDKISKILDDVEKEKGIDVRIHVDGASGGFVAPFLFPHLKWDFAVDRVDSINTSGHKFGMTTAGLGWVIWKDVALLPSSLKFSVDYLGSVEETFGLNFSRAGFPVIHQYYNFLRYGREGYTKIFESCVANARLFSNFLEESEYYEVLSVIHKSVKDKNSTYTRADSKIAVTDSEKFEPGLPVVAFRFSDFVRSGFSEVPQSIISQLLRNKGYIIPNYHLTPDETEKEILRVVVRESFSLNMMEKLINDLNETTELVLKACDSVRESMSRKESPEKSKEIIYCVLQSIATNGVDELKNVQHELYDKPGTGHRKHKKSYRGTC